MTFSPDFDPAVAKGLIAIDAQLNGLPVEGLPDPPSPSAFGWGDEPVFDSGVLGPFDNRWQLWRNQEGQLVVAVRGTVTTAGSVIEDLLAVMIPASGSIGFDGLEVDYKLAADSQAGVHLGFALGTFILLLDGFKGIAAKLIEQGTGKEVYITGHSQGASVATLVRSFLEYHLQWLDNSYRTYVFAQAKAGNDHYGYDFEFLTANNRTGFRLYNTLDWVPQAPLTLEWLSDLNEPNPLDVLRETVGKLGGLLEKGVEEVADKVAGKLIEKWQPAIDHLGEVLKGQTALKPKPAKVESTGVQLPKLLKTLNYYSCGSPISLPGSTTDPPPVSGDTFWQHHAGQYYLLLERHFPG